jgi:hypothetical protein
MQKTILSWGILALALTSIALKAPAQKTQSHPATSIHTSRTDGGNHQYLSIDEDSSTNPPQVIATYKSDALYNMILSGGKLTSLYINGRQVPADSFYLYDSLVRRIKDQMERDRIQAKKDQEQAERDAEQAARDREQAAKDKLQADRDAEQAERDAKQAQKDAEQAKRDAEQAIRDKKQAEEDKALVKSLLADVVKEGLAPDEKSVLSLILDDSVFFINGKKQSDELQKKFKEKFIKKEGNTIHFHHGSTDIDRTN